MGLPVNHNQIEQFLRERYPNHQFTFIPDGEDWNVLYIDGYRTVWGVPTEDDGRFSFSYPSFEEGATLAISDNVKGFLKFLKKKQKRRRV